MFLILIFFFIIILFLNELWWKRRHLPPGPIPIPLIGNLLSLRNPSPGYEAFLKWKKQYGDVSTFWLGTKPYILISSYKSLKETFIKNGEVYADKKPMAFQESFRATVSWKRMGNFGGITEDLQLHSFEISVLERIECRRDYFDLKILIEIRDIFNTCDNSHKDSGVNLTDIFDRAIGNLINQMLFGYRFGSERAEEFRTIRQFFNFNSGEFATFSMRVQFFLPWMGNIIPGPTIYDRFEKYQNGFSEFFGKQIENHRNEINFENVDNNDYVEAYLKEQRKRDQDGDFYTFSTKQLSNMCLDLWFAALMTTSNTVTWGFAFTLNYPDAQKMVHEELDRIIGSDREITTADKHELVYVNAYINEIQRCANLVPLNLLHMTTQDTFIDGYFIKKGTGVIAQISTVMYDEEVFPEPFKFLPERFIENGKLKKIDEFIPFSVGKRQCFGEGLARMELFLFFANFLNRYEITPDSHGPPCIDKSKLGGLHTKPFNAILRKRI